MDSMILLGKMFFFNFIVFLVFLALALLITLILVHNKVKRGHIVLVYSIMMFVYLGILFWISRDPQTFVNILISLKVPL